MRKPKRKTKRKSKRVERAGGEVARAEALARLRREAERAPDDPICGYRWRGRTKYGSTAE